MMARALLHLLLVILAPPLLLGVVSRTKAVFAGRAGPPLLQPYHDVWKLLRKGSVYSATTTWVFRAGPVVGLATALFAALLVPLGGAPGPISFAGDFVLFAYLFGLGRFFTVLAALDTGSAFESMGGAREVAFSCLAEPAFFLGMLVLARQTGSLALGGMLGPGLSAQWGHAGASLALVLVSSFIVLLAETSRIPFDDPNTHLELTMIHEVMVLDHSGPALGMIEYGAALKLFVLGAVIARIAVPVDPGATAAAYGISVTALLGVAVLVGVVESTMARLRLVHVPRLLVAACLLSVFAVILVAR